MKSKQQLNQPKALEYVLELKGLPKLNTAIQLDTLLPAGVDGSVFIKIIIPSGYFDNLDNELQEKRINQVNIQNTIATLTSPLSSMSPSASPDGGELVLNNPGDGSVLGILSPQRTTTNTAVVRNKNPNISLSGFQLYKKSVKDNLEKTKLYGDEGIFDDDDVDEEIKDFWDTMSVQDKKNWEEQARQQQ